MVFSIWIFVSFRALREISSPRNPPPRIVVCADNHEANEVEGESAQGGRHAMVHVVQLVDTHLWFTWLQEAEDEHQRTQQSGKVCMGLMPNRERVQRESKSRYPFTKRFSLNHLSVFACAPEWCTTLRRFSWSLCSGQVRDVAVYFAVYLYFDNSLRYAFSPQLKSCRVLMPDTLRAVALNNLVGRVWTGRNV